ncbi:MAG: clostripain-related cysteine peptidase, partial [Methanomassiliicoccales archaeon]|nr:clostripain-related cysteine peptidase [Methanomassiliicoccales archaeon]
MWRGVSATRLAACLLVLGLVGVQGTVAVGAVDRVTASWTFMVYLDGDNNLESCGVEDFMEMASVGSNTQINILVQFDRGTNSDSDGGSSDYGNWASTKRFHVSQGETPTAGNQISDLGEANMGSAATLQSFLEWGMNGYPASKYALVLWDHGGGWIYGVCSDDTDSDSLLMPEVRQAIANAEVSTGQRVDLVGFDACLMGMVEVAYDLRNYSDTVVFSEETEPGQGWAYDKVLASLAASPTMTSQQLGAVVVDAYSDYYGSSGKETLSAVSTSSLASVSSAVNSFAAEMSSAYPGHSGQINAVRSAVEHFEYEMIVDLYDLALRTKNAGITTALGNVADQLMSAIQAAVTQEAHGNLRPGAHGLSIYFPDVRSDLNLVGYRSDVLLTQDTSWDEFLETFFQGASSDQWEPDDAYTQASELVMGVPQYHSILDGGADVDWAFFTLPSATEVVIETSGVSGDTELYLFVAADVPSYYTAYDDDGGVDTFSRISIALPAGTYYIMVREYGQNREIDSYQLLITMPLQADAYEPDNDHAQASTIALDSMQLHSIGDGGADVDWISFTLATTQSVRIETTGESGDTRIWLYEEIGSQLFNVDWDDDSGPGLFSRLDEVDLAPGAYFIEVDEYYNDHEIALYQINVSSFSLDDEYEPDDDYLHANELVPGDSQWHSIGDGGQDVDWFQFPLSSDSDVLIETSG